MLPELGSTDDEMFQRSWKEIRRHCSGAIYEQLKRNPCLETDWRRVGFRSRDAFMGMGGRKQREVMPGSSDSLHGVT